LPSAQTFAGERRIVGRVGRGCSSCPVPSGVGKSTVMRELRAHHPGDLAVGLGHDRGSRVPARVDGCPVPLRQPTRSSTR
jgi:hypothetical protein